jgi:hypothetical protein
MGWGALAHKLLFAAGVVLLGLVVVYGGWQGWLGEPLQVWIKSQLDVAIEFYSANEKVIELSAKIIGAIFTAVTGVYGIVKARHYAEKRLPLRLDEFIQGCQSAIVEHREVMLGQLSLKYAESNIGRSRLWRRNSAAQVERYLKDLDEQAEQTGLIQPLTILDDRLNKLRQWTRANEQQKATAHLVRGLEATYQVDAALKLIGPHTEQTSIKLASMREKAVSDFDTAAKLDPVDFRPLEYSARQRAALKQFQKSIDDVNSWIQRAEKVNNEFQKARATSCLGQVLFELSHEHGHNQGQRRELRKQAKVELEKACLLFDQVMITDMNERNAERALAYERLGRVRIDLRTLRVARQNLSVATMIYTDLHNTSGLSRISSMVASLDAIVVEPATEGPESSD